MSRALFRLVGAAVVAVVATFGAAPREARAQACCGGGSTLTPWRLESHQAGLVGVRLSATPAFGIFGEHADFLAAPGDTTDLALEALVFGAVRVARRWQIGLQLPAILNVRASGVLQSTGGGLGDVTLGARFDPLFAGEHRLPGVAVEAAVTAPSGRAAEDATGVLAVDATGTGAWQIQAGLALEYVFGPEHAWLAGLRGGFRWYAPRVVAGHDMQRAVEGRVSLSLAYVLGESLIGAVATDFAWQGDDYLLTLGLSLGWTFAEDWRLVVAVSGTPPVDGFGRARNAAFGGSLTLVHAW